MHVFELEALRFGEALSKAPQRPMWMLTRTFRRKEKQSLTKKWVSIAAIVLILIFGGLVLRLCRDDAPAERTYLDLAAVKALPAHLRIPGYEDDIDPRRGVPMRGVAITGVSYDLGGTFSPTEFLERVQQHLRSLGWLPLEFSLASPHLAASDVAIWRRAPSTEHWLWEQAWVRNGDVVLVFGQYRYGAESENTDSRAVHVTIGQYERSVGKRQIEYYEELHGPLPQIFKSVTSRPSDIIAEDEEDGINRAPCGTE